MKTWIPLFVASLFAAALLSQTPGSTPFLEKPYLQLGDAPNLSASESLVLMWHTANAPSDWKVELWTSKDSAWRAAGQPTAQLVSAPAGEPAVAGKDGAKKDAPASAAIDAHLVFRARLTGLGPGEEFRYRVLQGGKHLRRPLAPVSLPASRSASCFSADQRSFPLTFVPAPRPDGAAIGAKGEVADEWKLDKVFRDGANASPHGVVYIVSGAGGADLYNPEQQVDPGSWQGFTDKFISQVHSLSVFDIDGKTFRPKQVSETGETVDSFQIAK